MSARLDAATAWSLVRLLEPGSVRSGERGRVESEGGAVLDVDADGGWSAPGPVDADAAELLDLYLPVRVPEKLVVGQLGQSLDGRIATESGASHYVTGPEDIERLHRLRALVDAVVVGASTVVADDPQLTVRLVEGESPVRVLLDPSRRVARDVRVRTDGRARTILVRGRPDDLGDPPGGVDDRSAASSADADEFLVPVVGEGRIDLDALLDALRAEGLSRVLVEGGGVTVSRFLEADLLDRLHVCVAPLLIGSGRPSLTLPPVERLDEARRPACRTFTLGRDVLFDLDLRTERVP